MKKIITKENRAKKIAKILLVFSVVITLYLGTKINKVYAMVTSTIEESSKVKSIANYTIDIENEEEVSDTIKDLILTINSEGMNKNLLSQTFNLYTQLAENYTNNEIVDMIEQNKKELELNNVKMDNIDNITTLLKSIDTNQLNKIISQIDVDEIAIKVDNGESMTSIIKDITAKMTTAEKVDFVMQTLSSAYIIKIVIVVFVVLFVYRTLLRCVIYKKADKKAWAAFIPIYRNVVMLKICGITPWWLLLLCVPVVGWILLYVISVSCKFMLAESFGKGTIFAFGLWLLSPIYETILVFSKKTKYIGIE